MILHITTTTFLHTTTTTTFLHTTTTTTVLNTTTTTTTNTTSTIPIHTTTEEEDVKEEEVILCDGCNAEVHLRCLNLTAVSS